MIRGKTTIEVRQRRYDYNQSIPPYYDSGNIVLTSEWEALALVTPPGERYFVRSVQRLASQAQDPDLKRQIDGFSGQEAVHAKETSRSLELLKARGFPVNQFHNWFDGLLHWLERFPLPRLHLSGTAAAEHYTAVFMNWHLSTQYCDRFHPVLRDYWRWHGAEEIEHKAVAFDLLQQVAPRNYFLRMAGFIIGIGVVWLGYRKAMSMLLKSSGLSRSQIREERKRARKTRIPVFSLRFPNFLNYLKPGFHPNHLDDGDLVQRVLEEQAAGAGV